MNASAKLVAAGAFARHESRGGHYRTDYQAIDEIGKRTFLNLPEAEKTCLLFTPPLEEVEMLSVARTFAEGYSEIDPSPKNAFAFFRPSLRGRVG